MPREDFRTNASPDLEAGYLYLSSKEPWGLVEEVASPREGSLVPGYQVPSSVMIWKCGDGSNEMLDELRVTRATESDRTANEENLSLPLNDLVQEKLGDATIRLRALTRARRLLDSVGHFLPSSQHDGVDGAVTSICHVRDFWRFPSSVRVR